MDNKATLSNPKLLPLVVGGPNVSHHVAVGFDNALYIHGGTLKKRSTAPSGKLYRLDLNTEQWLEMKAPGSPTRSHHSAVNVDNRYLVIIGGWTGKVRESNICVYDIQQNHWFFPKSHGFPKGAGLSSHATSLLANNDILIMGREGSLREQRRSGSGWKLVGSVTRGFDYQLEGSNFASRSGHTLNVCKRGAVIIGGRNDTNVEIYRGYKSPVRSSLNVEFNHAAIPAMNKPPPGRKDHITMNLNATTLLVHGGETFDGKNREPVGEMFLLDTERLEWKNIGISEVCREGHTSCAVNNSHLVIHGGNGPGNTVLGHTYKLAF